MQLHDPRAQWRAFVYNPRLQLSATLDTLPPGKPIIATQINASHTHLVVRDGSEYEEIAFEYAFSTDLPPWVGPRIYGILGVINPAMCAAGYQRTRWWGEGWTLGPSDTHLLENAGHGRGLFTRWQHAWLN